ncbi:ATP-binding protein [Aquicella lusitana]|uniref:histidine kinase n=1 Tax=Aquicella lusitana TaxID=254246 RepID=A0A370GM80_9COXI|nr:ATP-binding protein [Aquicella lusitana]RDI44757.1 PAS domain S-box-containing protein [Aquicella lusitana]VVC72954.1 Aerobic respiration control sensor protein ArcB [Aquicella lusitana]
MTDKDNLEQIIARQKRQIATLRAENDMLKKKAILSANNDKEFFALRDLIALMPGNIFWKDKEGKLLGCNNHLAKILSLTSPDEIIGKHTIDLVGAELAEQIDKIDKEIMASMEATSIEEVGFNEKHEPATYLSYKIPLRDRNGEVIGLLGTSLDITEHKRMEQELKIAKEKAEASNRAKSQFLAVVNHELRTPLTGILGLVNFLKQGNLSKADQLTSLEDLEHCAQNLLSLVNDVLDFSRLEAGKYVLNTHTSINLNTLINEALSITAALAKNKGLELTARLDQQPSLQIQTDPHVLRQILINIINNAIKFTEKGQIAIEVRILKRTARKAKLAIAVHDTGPGIPADKLELIFEPFRQLEDAYTRQSSRSGTGLGLAIVKRLAGLLNMTINVISEPGKGSTFTLIGEFEVPRGDSLITALHKKSMAYRAKHPDLPSTALSSLPKQKLKVLLIEDDKIVQRIHEKMLVDLGCEVEISAHGHDGLQALNNHDIIFVDIGLPDITGFEVIRTIRQHQDKEKRTLPIVALTGYTGEEEKSACLTAGANEIANKPISHGSLKEILHRYTKPTW